MPDKRPFVDRRLGFLVLFDGFHGGIAREEEATTKEGLNNMLDDLGYNSYVTKVEIKESPPQMKIILNDSSMKPESLLEISNRIEQDFSEVGGRVQTIEVVSFALSPGDKVRNALGV